VYIICTNNAKKTSLLFNDYRKEIKSMRRNKNEEIRKAIEKLQKKCEHEWKYSHQYCPHGLMRSVHSKDIYVCSVCGVKEER
jgi:hypothetical protein